MCNKQSKSHLETIVAFQEMKENENMMTWIAEVYLKQAHSLRSKCYYSIYSNTKVRYHMAHFTFIQKLLQFGYCSRKDCNLNNISIKCSALAKSWANRTNELKGNVKKKCMDWGYFCFFFLISNTIMKNKIHKNSMKWKKQHTKGSYVWFTYTCWSATIWSISFCLLCYLLLTLSLPLIHP